MNFFFWWGDQFSKMENKGPNVRKSKLDVCIVWTIPFLRFRELVCLCQVSSLLKKVSAYFSLCCDWATVKLNHDTEGLLEQLKVRKLKLICEKNVPLFLPSQLTQLRIAGRNNPLFFRTQSLPLLDSISSCVYQNCRLLPWVIASCPNITKVFLFETSGGDSWPETLVHLHTKEGLLQRELDRLPPSLTCLQSENVVLWSSYTYPDQIQTLMLSLCTLVRQHDRIGDWKFPARLKHLCLCNVEEDFKFTFPPPLLETLVLSRTTNDIYLTNVQSSLRTLHIKPLNSHPMIFFTSHWPNLTSLAIPSPYLICFPLHNLRELCVFYTHSLNMAFDDLSNLEHLQVEQTGSLLLKKIQLTELKSLKTVHIVGQGGNVILSGSFPCLSHMYVSNDCELSLSAAMFEKVLLTNNYLVSGLPDRFCNWCDDWHDDFL